MTKEIPSTVFDSLEQTLRTSGPRAAIDQLVNQLDTAGEYRALLDALLLRARHELGLPPLLSGSLFGLPETARSQYEERYIEAIRLVGTRFLARGEIPAAWSYFRAIGEPAPVADALDRYQPDHDAERLNQIIELAFHHGANPRRGFELILEHYGTCSAITALEQVPPGDPAVQVACIERLIRHLHDQLAATLRAEVRQRGEDVPENSSISQILDGRDWLLADEAYHTDISHLSAAVRYAILVTDPVILDRAIGLADYGRRLSPRLQFDGPPPFEQTFADHYLYLRATAGHDQDAAISHFRRKLDEEAEGDPESSVPAQVLVNLLARVGRLDEAIDLASTRLADVPDGALSCPGIAELCHRAGQLDRLARFAREHQDPVHFLAAILPDQAQKGSGFSPESGT